MSWFPSVLHLRIAQCSFHSVVLSLSMTECQQSGLQCCAGGAVGGGGEGQSAPAQSQRGSDPSGHQGASGHWWEGEWAAGVATGAGAART